MQPYDCIGYLLTHTKNIDFMCKLNLFLVTFLAINASLSVSTRGGYKPIALVFSACYTLAYQEANLSKHLSKFTYPLNDFFRRPYVLQL